MMAVDGLPPVPLHRALYTLDEALSDLRLSERDVNRGVIEDTFSSTTVLFNLETLHTIIPWQQQDGTKQRQRQRQPLPRSTAAALRFSRLAPDEIFCVGTEHHHHHGDGDGDDDACILPHVHHNRNASDPPLLRCFGTTAALITAAFRRESTSTEFTTEQARTQEWLRQRCDRLATTDAAAASASTNTASFGGGDSSLEDHRAECIRAFRTYQYYCPEFDLGPHAKAATSSSSSVSESFFPDFSALERFYHEVWLLDGEEEEQPTPPPDTTSDLDHLVGPGWRAALSMWLGLDSLGVYDGTEAPWEQLSGGGGGGGDDDQMTRQLIATMSELIQQDPGFVGGIAALPGDERAKVLREVVIECLDVLYGGHAHFSEERIGEFVREVDEFLVIAASDEAAVLALDASNFDTVVNDLDRDVMVDFFAPWCAPCQQLAPEYARLADHFANAATVTIAKMDATANPVPDAFRVESFPTLYLVTSKDKANPIPYEGPRSMESMADFIRQHATASSLVEVEFRVAKDGLTYLVDPVTNIVWNEAGDKIGTWLPGDDSAPVLTK